MNLKLTVTGFACLLLCGCASDRIIVDRKGIDEARYQEDLADCQRYASEVDTAGAMAKSAGVGAVIGGAMGAILGDGQAAGRIAGAGAVQGGAAGGLRADREKQQVVRRCLIGRGYKVLN